MLYNIYVKRNPFALLLLYFRLNKITVISVGKVIRQIPLHGGLM